MSIWHETENDSTLLANSAEVVFRIRCEKLPVDHAEELANSILHHVPWLENVPGASIHSVFVAGSQNGWERPDPTVGEWLILSRRTRLRIRLDKEQINRLVEDLEKKTIIISGETMDIESGKMKELQTTDTLYSRCCSFDAINQPESDETEFTDKVFEACNAIGFSPNKILCGKSTSIISEQGSIQGRSVLLADVPNETSLKLQDIGLGQYRLLGCGILQAHKATSAAG